MTLGSRTRKTKQSNPFIMLGLVAALVGMGLVGLAFWYYVSNSAQRADRLRISRGIELLNKLTEPAANYFYAGKGLGDKNEPLPPEAWAVFKAHENEQDFVDAMVTKSVGAENHFLDAFRYKTGKTASGEPIPGKLTTSRMQWYNTERGLQPDQDRAGIQILEGTSTIGGKLRKVIMFRRSILVNPDKPDLEYGKAMILLLADEPLPGAVPQTTPAEAPKSEAKTDAKPAESGAPTPPEKPAAGSEAKK